MATASLWQRPPSLSSDVVIVGAGVIGAATAWALHLLAPGLRVTILEAERPAFGASGRNAGFLLLGTSSDYASAVDAYGRDRARRIWAFTHEAYDAAAAIGARHDVGFRPTGSVLAAATTLKPTACDARTRCWPRTASRPSGGTKPPSTTRSGGLDFQAPSSCRRAARSTRRGWCGR